ncbi:hypothetical protein HGRIS_002528 [Hohenbuehelia grisea]|uniref:Uncharacterized protein n=1 Tax=Hohenbuehelia grisea TaxID=104357 RepID=A0ABR3JMV0_9AGAR
MILDLDQPDEGHDPDVKQRPLSLSDHNPESAFYDNTFLTFPHHRSFTHTADPPYEPYPDVGIGTPPHSSTHPHHDAVTSRPRGATIALGLPLRRPDRTLDAGRPPPLPDYETSQAMEGWHPPLRGKWLGSRGWRYTFYALLVYVALSMLVGIPLIVLKIYNHGRRHGPLGPLAMSWVDQNSYSSPLYMENGILVHTGDAKCDEWDVEDKEESGVYVSSTSFALPASGSLAIRATTLTSASPPDEINGKLRVGINPDASARRASFEVVLRASSVSARAQANICFKNSGDDRGLLIYVPTNLTTSDHLAIEVKLLLPQSPSQLKLKKLVTYLPGFSQHIEKLNDHYFNNLNLQGAGAAISLDSVRGEEVVVKNSLAPITGTFNATRHLELDTIEGFVRANITLVHDSSHEGSTYLNIDTGNADVQARIALQVLPKHSLLSPGPSFATHIKTFNGPVDVHVTHTPETSAVPLRMLVQNNLAPSNVTIDGKYEGIFDLQTKLSDAVLYEGEVDSAGDPSGQDREVNILYDYRSASRVFGWTGWGAKPKSWTRDQGHIILQSSMSPVRLQFGAHRSATSSRR